MPSSRRASDFLLFMIDIPEITVFHVLEQLKQAELLSEETRVRLVDLMMKFSQKKGKPLLQSLRHGLVAQDQKELRFAVDMIQNLIDPKAHDKIGPMTDHELEALLSTAQRKGYDAETMYIATGTLGHRIIIRLHGDEGALFMNDDRYGHEYRERFRELFELKPDAYAHVEF